MGVLAIAAFAAGALWAAQPGHEERAMVSRYVTAWEHTNYAQMYALLDRASRAHLSESRFARMLESAAGTATMRSLRPVKVGSRQGDAIPVRMQVAPSCGARWPRRSSCR